MVNGTYHVIIKIKTKSNYELLRLLGNACISIVLMTGDATIIERLALAECSCREGGLIYFTTGKSIDIVGNI